MRTKNFSLASGTDVWQQSGLWNVFKYESSTASGDVVSIRVRDNSGTLVDLECKTGRFIELPEAVEGITIESLTGGAVSGKVSIGRGKVSDSIITGVVSVADSAYARALASGGFGYGITINPGAGNFPHWQLWNGNAAKNLRVRAVEIESTLATPVFMGFLAVQLATNGLSYGPAKLAAGAVGVANTRYEGTTPGQTISPPIKNFQLQANVPRVFRFDDAPIIVPNGYGLTIKCNTAASVVTFGCEWDEVAV